MKTLRQHQKEFGEIQKNLRNAKTPKDLKRVKMRQEDLNSEFPETKKSLKSRGLSNMRELDEEGVQDLIAHLKNQIRNTAILLARNPNSEIPS